MKYYYIKVKLKSDKSPPYFIGSMLRGAFGHALKKITCINPSCQCEGCFATKECLYYDFYEKQNRQHKYRFDLKVNQKNYNFGIYLFAESCSKLPYILSSLEMALTQHGLGKERITFKNIEIDVNGVIVYNENGFVNKIDIDPKQIDIEHYSEDVKIKFITPLRIKKSNQLEYEKIRIDHILRSIYQRKKEIFENEKVYSLEYEPSYITSVKTLEYKPLYRKSDRQGKKIIMDGVLGEMAVIGLDQRSYELLKLGEFIGVGKQTVFGMGKIKVEEIDRK